jgi:putative SOS response-associated peptidase YedK
LEKGRPSRYLASGLPYRQADAHADWLDPDNQDAGSLQDLLRPYPAEALFARRVGTLVNNPRSDDPPCVQSVVA